MLGGEALELEIAILQYGEVRRELAKGFIWRARLKHRSKAKPLTGGFSAPEPSARLYPPADFDPHRRLARLGRPANVARLS
jgi:hypothetical protein